MRLSIGMGLHDLLRRIAAAGPAASTLLDDLVAYWTLDERSGTRADSVGSYDLTDNNTVLCTSRGPQGTVGNFIAANSEFLSRANSVGLVPGNGDTYSYMVWGLLSADGTLSMRAGYYVTDVGRTGGVTGYNSFNCYDSVLGWRSATDPGYLAYTNNGLSWSVSFTEVTTPGTMKVWRGGNSTPGTNTIENYYDSSAQPFYLNMNYGGGLGTGVIGPCAAWSRALTDDERTTLYNSGNGLRYADLPAGLKTNLISWWELDEVSGTRYDAHGSNDLTDNNTVTSVNTGPRGAVASFVAANTERLSFADATGIFKATAEVGCTVGGWLFTNSRPYPVALGRYCQGNGQREYELLYGSGSWYFQHNAGGASVNVGGSYGSWHFVLGRMTPAGGGQATLAISFDGGAFSAESAAFTPNANTDATLYLSGYATGADANGNWDDEMGPIGYWNTQLGDDDAAALFNSGKGLRYADLTDGLKTGLVSWWELDETSGTRADSHGSNDLTDNNTVTMRLNLPDCPDGSAAGFLDTNSESLTVTSLPIDASLGYTAAWWEKCSSSAPNSHSKFCHGNPVYYGGVGCIELSTAGVNPQYRVVYVYDDTTYVTAGWISNADEWHLVVLWYDPDTKKCGLSVDNGTPEVSASALPKHPVLLTGANAKLSLGSSLIAGTPAYFFRGNMDEVAIWNRVLTADERAELYALGKGKFYDFS